MRIAAVGVCHADVIVRDQLDPLPQPIVGGHEGAGVVTRAGSLVRGIQPGTASSWATPTGGVTSVAAAELAADLGEEW